MGGINYLFPPDQIMNLPSWRFILHFPSDSNPDGLAAASAALRSASFRVVQFPDGMDLQFDSDTNSVDVHLEVPDELRRREGSLAQYESDVWKVLGNMAGCGYEEVFYEAVDWKETPVPSSRKWWQFWKQEPLLPRWFRARRCAAKAECSARLEAGHNKQVNATAGEFLAMIQWFQRGSALPKRWAAQLAGMSLTDEQPNYDVAVCNAMVESTPENWNVIVLTLERYKSAGIGELAHSLFSPEGFPPAVPADSLYEATMELDHLFSRHGGRFTTATYTVTLSDASWSYGADFTYEEPKDVPY